jgi:pimeloyl-ACP methyl ester carboxylesterase
VRYARIDRTAIQASEEAERESRMPHLPVNGLDVFYRDEGRGTPILLAHCSTGSGAQWKALSARLATRFRLIAPDHIGYGRTSPYSGPSPVIEREIATMMALMDIAGSPAHLIGHSYGGSILARVAVRAPERTRSLTLIEPTLFYLLRQSGRVAEHADIQAVAERVTQYVDAGDLSEGARAFIDYWTGPGAYERMDERLRTSIAQSMPKLRREWPESFAPWGATIEALSALRLPILLISGQQTTPPALAVTAILRQVWPVASHVEVAGAGHMSPITHAGHVNASIEDFLSGLPA